MMSAPEKPKRISILERVEKVLENITAGEDYFYTVGANCVRGLRAWTEATGYPFDMIYLGSDHRAPEYTPDGLVYLYPKVLIASYVDSESGEPVTKLLRHLRDVEIAIEKDLRSNQTGSLAQLISWGHIAAVMTDEGELALDGLAGFRLEIDLCVVGAWGEF